MGGFLAPSLYVHDKLVGFELWALVSDQRFPLAARRAPRSADTGRFLFDPIGLAQGNAALDPGGAANTDLIIVDEFGPLEWQGQGWRRSVDRLATSYAGVLLLVVRESLVNEVQKLYQHRNCIMISALAPNSIDAALEWIMDE